MKKIPYFYLKDNVDEFLTHLLVNGLLQDYLIDLGNNCYFPLLYKNVDIKDRKRALFFSNNIKSISPKYISYFNSLDDNLYAPLLGNDSGYVIYPGSLMMGFSEKTFASFELAQVEESIDIQKKEQEEINR